MRLTRLLVASQTIILVGVILLTANTASTYHNWVIFYAFAQFIFGFGIGGEYPVRTLHLWFGCVHTGILVTVDDGPWTLLSEVASQRQHLSCLKQP